MCGFQCEQTARLRDKLIGALIGLARATDGNEHLISESSTAVIVESLLAADKDPGTLNGLLERVEAEKKKMVPDCFTCAAPCGKNNDYDMDKLRTAGEEIRSLKGLLLLGIRGMAADAYRAAALGHHEQEVDRFFYKALIVIGMDDWTAEQLLPVVLEMGKKCMAMLE